MAKMSSSQARPATHKTKTNLVLGVAAAAQGSGNRQLYENNIYRDGATK